MSGHRADVKPCGTEAAYRRHLRHGEGIDPSCRQWCVRDYQDRAEARNAVLRGRWAALHDAGYGRDEINRVYKSAARTAVALAADGRA